MKKYRLTKTAVKNILTRWAVGRYDEEQVRSEIEMIEINNRTKEKHSKKEYISILEEIVGQLGILHHQYMMKSDVPVFLKFLNVEPGTYEQAWQEWEDYWENIDEEARRKELAKNPFYVITGNH